MPAAVVKLSGFVGFSNLPHQVHRSSIKKGFQFTLMVVGESGLGKSTFVNTLFNTSVYPQKESNKPSVDLTKTVEIRKYSADIQEKNVRLKLNVIDTPGFGDNINNDKCWEPVAQYIEDQFNSFLDQEQQINRASIKDNRVHCCLYFISPTGHCLKPVDIEFMKRLHTKVCVIPVIAKADTLTDEECKQFKQRILDDIAYHQIKIFRVDQIEEEDEELKTENKALQDKVPFAIVASDKEYEVNGKSVRGRKYPWGVIEVENEAHCDFVSLRQVLIRSHMEDLNDQTKAFYENHRSEKLSNEGSKPKQATGKSTGGDDPWQQLEDRRKEYESQLVKTQQQYDQIFEEKKKEKEKKLEETEKAFIDEFEKQKQSLDRSIADLEARKKQLEEALSPKKSKKKSSSFF